ncbi:hypothetical protein GQ53DRAFT_808816 [Thozetella sp. PMI_491]|nr:hypothetical protein GQ53DRAFT_808816 [Thozetella sp. PMI_491]
MDDDTSPPSVHNPVGRAMVLTTALTLPIPTVFVFLRLWGRHRYRKPRGSGDLAYGEQAFWVFWSDVTILLSYITLLALSGVLFFGVQWGEGIHLLELTPHQRQQALIAYFLYSVFYKWGAGISKMATCLLLLAIATPDMIRFKRFCIFICGYVLAYSISCSLATVFQCGGDPRANWDHSLDQSACFYKPPFWFAHGALNIIAIIIVGILPWWLFASINFARKMFVATLMTVLIVGELIPSIVRLWGLYMSSQHLDDITFITTTGIFVSQLEVEFGVAAACVPTVLRLLSEGWSLFLWKFFNIDPTRSDTDYTGGSNSHQLAVIGNSKNRAHGLYTRYEDEEEEPAAVSNSQENIINKGGGDKKDEIRVEKSYAISTASATEEEQQVNLQLPGSATQSHVARIVHQA